MRPLYQQDDELADCADDEYPTCLRGWFATDTDALIAGMDKAASDPLPHELPYRERMRADWERRVVKAEALIARALHGIALHTDDVQSWHRLYALGCIAADREYGVGSGVQWKDVIADAAQRQWAVIAASRNDETRRAA